MRVLTSDRPRTFHASPEAPLVLAVDDDPSVRSSLTRLLRGEGYSIRTFASTNELSTTDRPKTPCCLILDVAMPGVNGLEFKEAMDRNGVRIPTIFITGYGSIPMGVDAMKGGAFDFLPKPFDVEQLTDVVLRALEEDERLLAEEREMVDLRRRFNTLTAREVEVLFAVTGGQMNKEAAGDMGITEKTIKVHRSRAMEKMGADSFASLVRMADLLRPMSPSPRRASVFEHQTAV